MNYITVQFDGFHLNIIVPTAEDYKRSASMVLGTYEPMVNQRIKRGGNIFVDVGAHVGYFSMEAAKHFDYVISIEPHPENFYWLKRNIDENGCQNVISYQKALFNRTGFATMKLSDESMSHSIKSPQYDTSLHFGKVRHIIIPITTLDSLVVSLQIDHVDLIKIDVEGAELEVLQGASNTLEKVKEIIVEAHGTARQVQKLLSSKGFTCLPLTDIDNSHGWLLALKKADLSKCGLNSKARSYIDQLAHMSD